MTMAKSVLLLISVICFAGSISFAARAAGTESVQHPLLDYLVRVAHSNDDDVLSFAARLRENDEYMFVSLERLINGKAGNIWQVYARGTDGYQRLSEPVSLRRDALAFTNIAGIEGSVVVTYWPQNAERGSVRAVQISGDEVMIHNIGEIEPAGKDKDMYADFFLNESHIITIEERSVQEIMTNSTQLQPQPSMGNLPERREYKPVKVLPGATSEIDHQASFHEGAPKEPSAHEGRWAAYTLGVLGILSLIAVATFRSRARRSG